MLTASLTTPWSSLFFGRSSLRSCIKVRGGDEWGGGGGGGGVGGYDQHTRSTAADQPALLPDYKITWFWGGVGGGHDKHTRSTAADASFTPEAFTGPTFGSRTMGHHFVLALCVAYVLLLRVACAPCPIVDSWLQAFWTCDPFLLDAHFEVFAGSLSGPFVHFAASVGAISARSPLSWCRLAAALPRLRAAWLTLSRARSPLTPALRAACFVLSRRLLVINFTSAPSSSQCGELAMSADEDDISPGHLRSFALKKKEAGSLKKRACVGQQREVLLFSGDFALSCQSQGKNGTK